MSITLAILSLVAGSLAQEIKTDYDRKADFSLYKTFSFEKVETKDPLWVDRITAAIGGELTAKGLTKVASGGDIAIVAIEMTADRQTLDTFYDTFPGGWGWRWGLSDTSEVDTNTLWIEAEFEFPELKRSNGKYATIPSYFGHMQLATADGIPRIRFRLRAQIDEDGEIDEELFYVVEVDDDDEPKKVVPVSKHDRNAIHVHYLPARRDPADHVTYAASSLLGRALRSANWTSEREAVVEHAHEISEALAGNQGVREI